MVGERGGCHLPEGEEGCHELLESEDYRGNHPNAHLHLRTEVLIHFHWACLDPGDQETASSDGGGVGCRESGHLPLSCTWCSVQSMSEST